MVFSLLGFLVHVKIKVLEMGFAFVISQHEAEFGILGLFSRAIFVNFSKLFI